MKVVVLLGGLGSQMLKYAFYLLLREKAEDDCYICTLPYDLMDMWNGYELEKIFGIKAPDFNDFIEHDIIKTTDNYAQVILEYMRKKDLNAPIYVVNRGKVSRWRNSEERKKFIVRLNEFLLRAYRNITAQNNIYMDKYPKKFADIRGNVLYDEFNHTSDQYIKNDKIDLRRVFTFPEITEKGNLAVKERMLATESIAIHIRRSDHMYDNCKLFERGYFVKAVNFIKSRVKNPSFYVFSEESDWCRNNAELIGLDINNDDIVFVDWNQDEQSFRDMQLMTYCKHNVLAISTFSWWGYYLSQHSKKIVCAPKEYWFEVPYHF